GMSVEAGLLWELENLAPVFRQMQTWDYSSPRIREFRMEELIANPFKIALESFGFLGLLDDEPARGVRRLTFAALSLLNKAARPWGEAGRRGPIRFAKITAERLLGIVHAHDFKRLSGGRRQGHEAVTSRRRAGDRRAEGRGVRPGGARPARRRARAPPAEHRLRREPPARLAQHRPRPESRLATRHPAAAALPRGVVRRDLLRARPR